MNTSHLPLLLLLTLLGPVSCEVSAQEPPKRAKTSQKSTQDNPKGPGCLGASAPEACEPTSSSSPSVSPTAKNVQGTPLQVCSKSPLTGFWRDGFCHTGKEDRGIHVVCAKMTPEFLAFTKAQGNDLSSPSPRSNFPGLRPGDGWCLCASRWQEAMKAGAAPKVKLEATHKRALDSLSMGDLKKFAQ